MQTHTDCYTRISSYFCLCEDFHRCNVLSSPLPICDKSNYLDTICKDPQLIGSWAASDQFLIKNVMIDVEAAVVGWSHRIWDIGGKHIKWKPFVFAHHLLANPSSPGSLILTQLLWHLQWRKDPATTFNLHAMQEFTTRRRLWEGKYHFFPKTPRRFVVRFCHAWTPSTSQQTDCRLQTCSMRCPLPMGEVANSFNDKIIKQTEQETDPQIWYIPIYCIVVRPKSQSKAHVSKKTNERCFLNKKKKYIIIIIMMMKQNMDSFTLHMATPGRTRTRTERLPGNEPPWIPQLRPLQARRSKVIQHLD